MTMELIKIVRDLKNWSRNKLAKQLRMEHTTLSHYEDTPVTNREILLVKLKKLSNLPVEEFWEIFEREVIKEDRKRRKGMNTPTEADL